MPKIWTDGNISIIVYTRNEHQPAHVHVISSDYEVKIDIKGDSQDVLSPSKNSRVKTTSQFTKKAQQLVKDRLAECRAVWRAKNGEL